MSLTAERITVQVAEMIESIRAGLSFSFAQYSAEKTQAYITDVYESGLIDSDTRNALEAAVVQVMNEWKQQPDRWDHLINV
jgi:argininosuccinate lyase